MKKTILVFTIIIYFTLPHASFSGNIMVRSHATHNALQVRSIFEERNWCNVTSRKRKQMDSPAENNDKDRRKKQKTTHTDLVDSGDAEQWRHIYQHRIWFPQSNVGNEDMDFDYIVPFLRERLSVFVRALASSDDTDTDVDDNNNEELLQKLESFNHPSSSVYSSNFVASSSFWYDANFNTFCAIKNGLMLSVKNTGQILTAFKTDHFTDLRKKQFSNLMHYVASDAAERIYYSDTVKRTFDINDEQYMVLLNILTQYRDLDEIPDTFMFNRRSIKATLSEMFRKSFLHDAHHGFETFDWNEITLLAPDVVGVFHKGYSEIPKVFEQFARDHDIPIFYFPEDDDSQDSDVSEDSEYDQKAMPVSLLSRLNIFLQMPEIRFNRNYAQMLLLNKRLYQAA